MRQAKKRVVLMLSLGLSFGFLAPCTAKELVLAANAPDSYIVQPGDTLWEISGKFLDSPWEWEAIWESNPELKNPHCIYPGDEIRLKIENGRPRLYRANSNVGNIEIVNRQTGVVKLKPRIRKSAADRAISAIPLHVIEPFFNPSRVVTTEQAQKCPRIVALDEDHLVVGEGDRMYVNGLPPNAHDEIFAIFRPEKIYQNARGEFLGIEGLVLGKARIERPGKTTRMLITDSYAEIKAGDRLISTIHETLDPFFIPKLPRGNAKGQIISVFGGVTQIGQYQVLVVTGGRDCGRTSGDVLGIYQTHKDIPMRLRETVDKHVHFPPLKVGNCVVFRVFDKVSYVLVMNAVRPIYLLDAVAKP